MTMRLASRKTCLSGEELGGFEFGSFHALYVVCGVQSKEESRREVRSVLCVAIAYAETSIHNMIARTYGWW